MLTRARGTLLLGLLSGACRPHVTVCDSDCDEPFAPIASDGGTAGDGARTSAGGSPTSEAGGSAGATDAECARAEDCDDGVFCNGAERCDGGVCEDGSEPKCDAGTTCVEGESAASCAYAEPSPWLLLLTNREVLGLPTAELGKRPLLTLGERPSEDVFVGFNEVEFSPDGRHALLDYIVPDSGQQVLELAFDEGVPKLVQRVKNLPNWGVYGTPIFSRDGARALLFERGSGAYLLDLTGQAAVPASLSVPPFADWEITFCRASDTWVKAAFPSTMYSLVDGSPLATELDGEVVAVSPDGLRVWLRGENARIASCDADSQLGPSTLPDAEGTWSPDSRRLLAALDDGSAKLYGVSPALGTTELWSTDALGSSAWSSDGRALLVRLDGGTEPTFAYLDLAGDAPIEHPLGLASAASVGQCSDDGCLAFLPRMADDGIDLLWQPFVPHAAPGVLATRLSSESALLWADFERRRLVLKRAGETDGQLMLADFQGSPERPVFSWSGATLDAEPASDGSGLLVQLTDDVGYSNFWVALPAGGSGEDAAVAPLDVPAYRSAFQPWPRQQP